MASAPCTAALLSWSQALGLCVLYRLNTHFVERKPGKAGRAYPEAAQVGKLQGGDMMLSLTAVALRMWCVLQGVPYSGTQRGLAEV